MPNLIVMWLYDDWKAENGKILSNLFSRLLFTNKSFFDIKRGYFE